jgi:hypothetical protein
VKLNSARGQGWGSQDSARATLCHEIDHLLGLNHNWAEDSAGIDVIGSKASCIGHDMPGGPGIDDNQALDAVYSGDVP